MNEKDLVYLLKHIDSDEDYSKDLGRLMRYANKMLGKIEAEHILDSNQYKVADLHRHIEQVLLLTCEICSGVSRSEYTSDETLDEYMKSKAKLETMWNSTASRPDEVKSNSSKSFQSQFYSLAVEYLENTNFDKVTIATVSKYIVANMYDIKLEKHNKTAFQMVKAKRGSDEADKFLKHITEVFKLLLAYPQKYSKREILAKLRSKIV